MVMFRDTETLVGVEDSNHCDHFVEDLVFVVFILILINLVMLGLNLMLRRALAAPENNMYVIPMYNGNNRAKGHLSYRVIRGLEEHHSDDELMTVTIISNSSDTQKIPKVIVSTPHTPPVA